MGGPHQSTGTSGSTHVRLKRLKSAAVDSIFHSDERSFSGAGPSSLLKCHRQNAGTRATINNSGTARRRARSSGLVLGAASERITALGVLLCRYCASVTGGEGLKRCSCHRNRLTIAGGAGVLARIVPPPNGPHWERDPGPRAHRGSMTHNYHSDAAGSHPPSSPALH